MSVARNWRGGTALFIAESHVRPFHPFLLNPNIYTNSASVAPSYGTAMPAVNYNTGNLYIAYSVLKDLFGSAGLVAKFPHVNNIWEDDLDRRADRINGTHTHVLLFLVGSKSASDNGFNKWNKLNALIEKIRVPIVVFSLGANSFIGWDTELHTKLAPGLVRFLRLLAERTNSAESVESSRPRYFVLRFESRTFRLSVARRISNAELGDKCSCRSESDGKGWQLGYFHCRAHATALHPRSEPFC